MRANITLTLFAFVLLTSGTVTAFAQQSLEKLERMLDEEPAVAPAPAPPVVPEPATQPPRRIEIESEPRPGYLGLYAIEVDGRLIVESVRPGSPAEAATVRPGDQILRIGGAALSTLDEMSLILDSLMAGSRVSMLVKRHGRDVPMLATLGERPSSAQVVERSASPQPTPAEPAGDSLHALSELERLLEDAPPVEDVAETDVDAAVLRRVRSMEAELKLINARIQKLERSLSGIATADE